MLKVISRVLGYWLTAAALVAVVVDGAKSIAASALVTTSLADAWRAMSVAGAAATETASSAAPVATGSPGWGLDAALPWLLSIPVAAAAGMAGILLLLAGRKRRRYSLSREFAA